MSGSVPKGLELGYTPPGPSGGLPDTQHVSFSKGVDGHVLHTSVVTNKDFASKSQDNTQAEILMYAFVIGCCVTNYHKK